LMLARVAIALDYGPISPAAQPFSPSKENKTCEAAG
jgi:hypothetical protein